jgi:DNA-binding transcriptional MocR family regulator
VAFIPGSAFSLRRDVRASNCMRLNFSNCSLPHIEEGIERLGRVIGASLRH